MPTNEEPEEPSREDLIRIALKRHAHGESMVALGDELGISVSVLKYHKKRALNDQDVRVQRGPAPVLGAMSEHDVVAWALGMQFCGFPVDSDDILDKVNAICHELKLQPLTSGWLQRFRGRHPILTPRTAQVLARPRNEVSPDAMRMLFHTISKLVIEEKMDASRVFNLDETGFDSKRKSQRVLGLRGSSNVWAHAINTSFHMSIAVCVSASGYIIPPLFILEGERATLEMAKALTVPGSELTMTDSGFINAKVFELWLHMFHKAIPDDVKRPVVLVADGFSSHFTLEVVTTATALGILLLCLPPNATHLIQPLDVAIFAPFKKLLRKEIKTLMRTTAATSVSKVTALKVASTTWVDGVAPQNAINGFKVCGLYPPSMPAMCRRFDLFKNGTKINQKKLEEARYDLTWLKHQQRIRDEMLVLPPEVDKTRRGKRKTMDIGGKLVTAAMIAQELEPEPKPTRKKQKKSPAKKTKAKVTKKTKKKPTTTTPTTYSKKTSAAILI